MKINRTSMLTASALSTILLLSGCGTDTGGGSADSGTTISGKVTLSGVVASGKAKQLKAMSQVAKGNPNSKMYKASLASQDGQRYSFLPSVPVGKAFAYAKVSLYDADHPEWLSPVASTATDADGNYTLSTLSNAADNGNAYVDGDPIPGGHYTLIAYDVDPASGALVAMQTVAQDFSGSVTGNDLEAVPSDIAPTIDKVVGQSKNLDGTESWGNASDIATNAGIQVSFSMPMARDTVTGGGIELSPAEAGKWEISPDWLTATFHPDDGALEPSTTYTITVKGDDTYKGSAVQNVYFNRLAKTATGTFTTRADADTTAPTVTFSVNSGATGVDVTTPLTLTPSELLDVSRLSMSLSPSVGSKPIVLYSFDDTNHVYELILASPLTLGTHYTGTISGAKDLAGNAMSDITVDFTTSSGISAVTNVSTDADVATVQAAAADVFQRWVTAMDKHDLPKMQSLMAGHFAMDYDLANGFDSETDINRDGIYSLDEFSKMLSQAFLIWDKDSCDTTITGSIVGDINADAANSKADFEFKLDGTSTVGGQDCSDATPKESLFATVRKISGIWKVEHASDGIDTRNQTVDQATVLSVLSPAEDTIIKDQPQGPPLFCDDPQPATQTDVCSTASQTALKFEWTAVSDAASYVFIVMDAKDPSAGMAMVLPSDKSVLDFGDPNLKGDNGPGYDVSEDFGFHNEFRARPGSELYWQIAALGNNTVDMIKNGRNSSLPKDVTAISKMRRALISGVYHDMSVAMTLADGTTPVTYSEIAHGFKLAKLAGNTGTVNITVTTENDPDPTTGNPGVLRVDGAFRQELMLDFNPATNQNVTAGTTTRNGQTLNTYAVTVPVQLSIGQNHVFVADMYDPMQYHETPKSLAMDFNIHTDQGLAPIVDITSVTDVTVPATPTALTGDAWDYYMAPTGATTIKIAGTVNTAYNANQLNINLWNDELQANVHQGVPVDPTTGAFSVTLDIYHGNNWIGVDGGVCEKANAANCSWATDHVGVNTDTGAVYVPPISLTSVADGADATVMLTATEAKGNYARYDASTIASNTLTITGKMVNFRDPADSTRHPTYGAGSEGGWQGGDLSVDSSGNFTITMELFRGYNHVDIQDVAGSWFGMEIYTSAGKPVIKPVIDTIDGTTFVPSTNGGPATASVDNCAVTITGTAKKGEVNVNWSGFDGTQYYWESQRVQADGTGVVNADGVTVYPFSVTMSIVSGTGATNNIDIFDKTWNWQGLQVSTTATCPYVMPQMTVDTVSTGGAALTDAGGMNFDAGSNTSIDVAGTSNRPGQSISVELNACGSRDTYSAMAGTTANAGGTYDWSVTGVTVYDGGQNLNISDGVNWSGAFVNTMNGVMPVPPINVSGLTSVSAIGGTAGGALTSMSTDCGHSSWDAGSAQFVRISGTSASKDTRHNYFAGGTMGEFTTDATTGAFSFDVEVFDGYNNVSINDPDFNNYGLDITATNGNMRPQYVEITSPADGDIVSGPVTVDGTIYVNAKAGGAPAFNPSWVGAAMNDFASGTHVDYSADPNGPPGAQQMTLINNNDGTYTFSFTVNVTAGNKTDIDVWARDNNGGNHGITIVLNPQMGNTGHYYKAGVASAGNDAQRLVREISAAQSKALR